MLDNKLIENALKLTSKTMEDMEVEYTFSEEAHSISRWYEFSIEKFCYYLLSTSFIGKYTEDKDMNWAECSQIFWNAIYEYQAWLETPLIELLNKICQTDQTM